MRKKTVLLFLMFLSFQIIAQELESGFTQLILKLPEKPQPHILYYNALSGMKPASFTKIDEDTYLYRFYSIGPTGIRLTMDEEVYPFLIAANSTSTISYDLGSKTYSYQGEYEGTFKESLAIYKSTELIVNHFVYSDKKANRKLYDSSLDFKNDHLEFVDSLTKRYSSSFEYRDAHTFFYNSLMNFMNSSYLDFDQAIRRHNRNYGLDSVEVEKNIPERDLDYYDGIIERSFSGDSLLISADLYSFISALIQDPILDLPDIVESASSYKGKLQASLDCWFKGNELFYELILGVAYSHQINEMGPLNPGQQKEILDFFTHSSIADYLLYENDKLAQLEAQSKDVNYLPSFDQGEDAFKAILENYLGKIVFVDFWATWCGPCIFGFKETDILKDKLSDRQDVVFLYITDESSNVKLWREYVSTMKGTHYFIKKSEMHDIYEAYNFSSIPNYFLIDKEGKVVDSFKGITSHEKFYESISNIK